MKIYDNTIITRVARIGGTVIGGIAGKIVGGKINHPVEGTVVGGTIGYLATDSVIIRKENERIVEENAILSAQLAGIQPADGCDYDDISDITDIDDICDDDDDEIL